MYFIIPQKDLKIIIKPGLFCYFSLCPLTNKTFVTLPKATMPRNDKKVKLDKRLDTRKRIQSTKTNTDNEKNI